MPENVPQGADLTELGRQGLEVVQGPALIGAAVARARDLGVQVLQLTVTEGNDAARRLYEACGFQCWGVEPAAVQLGERLLGKAHLWRELR